MIEIDHCLRRKLGGQTHVSALAESVLSLFQQFVTLRTESMGEEEERRRVRFNVTQRHYVKIDVGNLPAAVGHFVTQDAFGLNPIVFRGFTNDHQQVISHCVAMRRAADQFTEQ